MVDISGLSSASVLVALYNASKPQGSGFVNFDPKPMSEEEAAELLKQQTYFDYLRGRVMKVDLSDNSSFDPWGYDRDNGQGAAQRTIDSLKNQS